MQSSTHGWWRVLSGTAMMFCVAACTAQPPTPPQAPKGVTRAMATVVRDAEWTPWQKESESEFQCDAGKVLVGREREGQADENDRTRHLCGIVMSEGKAATTEVGPWSGLLDEKGSKYSCDEIQYQNQVIVGRSHKGDGEDDDPGEGTRYRCAKLINDFGDELFVSSGELQKIESEYHHLQFLCAQNQVIVYRAHDGDEEGATFYKCATIW